MKDSTLGKTLDRQDWLEPVENAMEAVSRGALEPLGQKVRNFLHGTWLGHPLHPVLTDVPVGAWTTAAALDIYEMSTGKRKYAAGSDAAVRIGLTTAVATAITGLNDWKKTDRPAKRVGVVHALLNAAATVCYTASWLQRRRGQRTGGMISGFLGYGLMLTGAYFGAHLVYSEGIGVDHSEEPKETEEWTTVMAVAALAENQPHKANADGVDIVLVKRQGQFFAIAEKCSHMGGPLSEGTVEGNSIQCPWHGSRFSLETGEVLDGPATYNQPCFNVRVRDGQIQVRPRKTPLITPELANLAS